MAGLFDFFTRSMEAFQESQRQMLSTFAPVAPEEFSKCESDGQTLIYVEGQWRSLDEFINLYKKIRDENPKTSLR